jgi:hypothetical protein
VGRCDGDVPVKISASIELIWSLAAREAVAAEYKEIEPEHFLAALCKFSELGASDIERAIQGGEAAKRVLQEVEAVRAVLSKMGVDSTQARRKVRELVGHGGQVFEGGVIHRSPASRGLFDIAARVAATKGREALSADDILEGLTSTPTPRTAEALGRVGPSHGAATDLPLKQFSGSEGRTPGTGARAAGIAIVDWIGRSRRPVLLLISDNASQVSDAVAVAAGAMADTGAAPAIRGRKIWDLVTPFGQNRDAGDRLALFSDMLAQAARDQEGIAFVPPIESPSCGDGSNEVVGILTAAAEKGGVRCLAQTSTGGYDRLLDLFPKWKRLSDTIRIHTEPDRDVPMEL